QKRTDEQGTESSATEIWKLFKETYVDVKHVHYSTKNYKLSDDNGNQVIELDLEVEGQSRRVRGEGNAPISAILDAHQLPIGGVSYEEQSICTGAHAEALALFELQVTGTGKSALSAGMHDNIVTSSIEAILASTSRLIDQGVLS